MFANLIALDFLLVAVAGLVNQHELHVIDYLQEENRILREMPGKKSRTTNVAGSPSRRRNTSVTRPRW